MKTKQARYRQRQIEKGLVYVSFWVPKAEQEKLKEYVKSLTNKGE